MTNTNESSLSSPLFRTFQIDKECFIFYIPNERTAPLLRIGYSSSMTPSLKKQVGLVLLNDSVKVPNMEEWKNLKEYPETSFMGLPLKLRSFREELQRLMESQFQFSTIPFRTGNLDENRTRIQALYYKDNNLRIISGDQVLFDLNNSRRKGSDFEKNRKEAILFSELIAHFKGNEDAPFSFESILLASTEEKEEIKNKILSLLSDFSLDPTQDKMVISQGKDSLIDKEIYYSEFTKNSWSRPSIEIECDRSFVINKPINVSVYRKENRLLSLDCKISQIWVLQSKQLYQYQMMVASTDQEAFRSYQAIKLFRFFQLIHQFIETN